MTVVPLESGWRYSSSRGVIKSLAKEKSASPKRLCKVPTFNALPSKVVLSQH